MAVACADCRRQQSAIGALAARGVRLTGLRRDVLDVLHHARKPLGAYDLYEVLKYDDRASAPPAVYRVLDFLVGQGLAHKLQTVGAYTACHCEPGTHQAIFHICRNCRTVAESAAGDELAALGDRTSAIGFRAEHLTVEITGLCRDCAQP
ncbi:MAG: Fur family transcriptional regulator [Paracoccaceae bacterium]